MTPTELCEILTHARDHSLGLTTLHALSYIHLHQEVRMNDLCRHIGCSSATLTQVAHKLVSLGFVTRRSGTSDRRNIWLEIAPKGTDVITSALLGPALA